MCIQDEFAEPVGFEVDGKKRVNSQKKTSTREGML
jgi:mTERF domain-containing protein